jgi:hypothetical protein
MQNRTVAFIDILGFKELVKTTPLEDLAVRFQKTLTESLPKLTRPVMQPLTGPRLILDGESKGSWCLQYSFSDTIILISHDETELACLKLLLYAFRVLQYLTVAKLYARGGVSFGEMFVGLDRQIFLGKALIEAFELERSQDWIGCAILESVERSFPKIFENPPIMESVFPFYEVPMKEGPVKQLRTINWRWNLIAKCGTRSLFQSPNNWPIRRKVENTLAYAGFIRRTGKAYPTDGDCPAELCVAFVGQGPPPPNALPAYPHGDEL